MVQGNAGGSLGLDRPDSGKGTVNPAPHDAPIGRSSVRGGSLAWPGRIRDFASGISARQHGLAERLASRLSAGWPRLQLHQSSDWPLGDTGPGAGRWVERLLSPIKSTVSHLQRRLAIHPDSREPLTLSWALPPERMANSHPYDADLAYRYDGGADDSRLEFMANDVPGQEGEFVTEHHPGHDVRDSQGGKADTSFQRLEHEVSPPRRAIPKSLLALDSLMRGISRRLAAPDRSQFDRGQETSPRLDVVSRTRSTDTTRSKPAIGDLAHRGTGASSEMLDMRVSATSEAGEGHPVRRDISVQSAHGEPGLPLLREVLQRHDTPPRRAGLMHEASHEAFAPKGLDTQKQDTAEPIVRSTGIREPRLPTPGAPFDVRTSPGECRAEDSTGRVDTIRPADGESGLPLFREVLQRYEAPERRMRLAGEASSEPLLKGTSLPEPWRPSDPTGTHAEAVVQAPPETRARSRGLPEPSQPMPEPQAASEPPSALHLPSVPRGRRAPDYGPTSPLFEKRSAVSPGDQLSPVASDLIDSGREQPIARETLETAGNQGQPSEEREPLLWEDAVRPSRAYGGPPRSLRFPPNRGRSRSDDENLPLLVLAGSQRQGSADQATVAMAPIDRAEARGNSPMAASATTSASPGDAYKAPNVDLDSLARDVYQIIKQRLAWEKERRAFGG